MSMGRTRMSWFWSVGFAAAKQEFFIVLLRQMPWYYHDKLVWPCLIHPSSLTKGLILHHLLPATMINVLRCHLMLPPPKSPSLEVLLQFRIQFFYAHVIFYTCQKIPIFFPNISANLSRRSQSQMQSKIVWKTPYKNTPAPINAKKTILQLLSLLVKNNQCIYLVERLLMVQ